MVSKKSVEKQLKHVNFNPHGWGRGEVSELHRIILPDEQIYEGVNGIYEGGFALLVATDVRVLLIDKKPLNFLTVEDLRFDQINELDYSHRILGAYITISSGSKTLRFRSYNQPRLRKLIHHVQHCMAEGKKKQSSHQEDQNQHLEQINQQLQSYLVAQSKQQQVLYEQLQQVQKGQQSSNDVVMPQPPEPIKPSPELADYLFAQSLIKQHEAETGQPLSSAEPPTIPFDQMDELYAAGREEIFAKSGHGLASALPTAHLKQLSGHALSAVSGSIQAYNPLPVEINPLKVAYSKLPMALRNRKFGRPRFHDHSQGAVSAAAPTRV